MALPPRITLLTDFGTTDGYVAAMKGVIAAILPAALIDDAGHDIAAGDVHAAAWALGAYWRLYPAGTVHLAVVDPGVGSARRPLAIEADGRYVVAPDNGLATAVLEQAARARAVEIRVPDAERAMISATFHGRDVFAPAAARIAAGVPFDELGPAVSDPVRLAPIPIDRAGPGITGTVVHVDRFGNLVTNIPADAVGAGWVELHDVARIPVVRSYHEVAQGAYAALVGSRGTLEVAVRDGSAAGSLGVGRGAAVRWVPDPDATPDR